VPLDDRGHGGRIRRCSLCGQTERRNLRNAQGCEPIRNTPREATQNYF
jgi:hypothetical protein